jgi:hypothetical protein
MSVFQMLKTRLAVSLAALLLTISLSAWAQQPNSPDAIKQALVAKYALTTTTADKTDIVTAGAILVLKKTDLLTLAVASKVPSQNTYKDGKINHSGASFMKHAGLIPRVGGNLNTPSRTFVNGEKVWVTAIDVRPNDVVFTLFTDAYSDVRYAATLSFPFPKGTTPSADQVAAMVGEVFDIQPQEKAADAPPANAAPGTAPSPAGAPAPIAPPPPPAPDAQAKPADIPPPPPPPADPKTLSIGQTIDEVVSNFGQPEKIVKLATKQIYYYKDMKVTFVNGKVSNVE